MPNESPVAAPLLLLHLEKAIVANLLEPFESHVGRREVLA